MSFKKIIFTTLLILISSINTYGAAKANHYISKLIDIRSNVTNLSYKATKIFYDKNDVELPDETDVVERVRIGPKLRDIRFGKSVTFVDNEKHKVVYAKKGEDMSEQTYSGDIELEPEDRLLILLSKQSKQLQMVTENSSLVTFVTDDPKLATETVKVTFIKKSLSIKEATISNPTTGLMVIFTQEGRVDKDFFIPTIQTATIFKGGVFFRKIVTTYEKFVIDPDEDKIKFSIEKIKERIRGGVKND